MALVRELVADAEVEPRAIAMVKHVAELAPLAVQQIKEVILAGRNASLDRALRWKPRRYSCCSHRTTRKRE